MAERRMLSNKIVGSDDYYSLSFCAQSLYVQLNMVADDDGVVQSPKKVFSVMCREVDPDNPEIAIQRMKQIKDAFDELAQKRFVLTFPSGVVVIKHWCMKNSIRKAEFLFFLVPKYPHFRHRLIFPRMKYAALLHWTAPHLVHLTV